MNSHTLPSAAIQYQHIEYAPKLKILAFPGKTLFLGGSKSAYISSDDLPAIQLFFPNAAVKHIEVRAVWGGRVGGNRSRRVGSIF